MLLLAYFSLSLANRRRGAAVLRFYWLTGVTVRRTRAVEVMDLNRMWLRRNSAKVAVSASFGRHALLPVVRLDRLDLQCSRRCWASSWPGGGSRAARSAAGSAGAAGGEGSRGESRRAEGDCGRVSGTQQHGGSFTSLTRMMKLNLQLFTSAWWLNQDIWFR